MDNSPEEKAAPQPRKRRKSIWFQIHFWIGWIAALPIIVVCITGTLATFDEAIFRQEHYALFHLEATGKPMSTAEVLRAYEQAEPRLRVNHLGVPESPTHAYSAYVTEINPDGKNRSGRVYFNQYTGEFTWAGDEFSWAETIIDLHRHLGAGKTGQQIVGISSLLLAIVSIVGLVLWWPMRGRTFARAISRGKALDWHNAVGVIALLPLVVMAITGITFTWGKHIFPSLEKLQGKPSSVQAPVVDAPEGAVRVPFEAVLSNVTSSMEGQRLTGIQPSNGRKRPHVFIFDNGSSSQQVFVDPFTGTELLRFDGSGTGPVGFYKQNFGRWHTMGSYGAIPRYAWSLLSLAGAILAITGIWVSVKRLRRPKRRAA